MIYAFPELCRNLALRGANLIVVPAQWPAARENHWRVLLQARAIEKSSCFSWGVNRIGRDDNGLIYHGHSMAVAPRWYDFGRRSGMRRNPLR